MRKVAELQLADTVQLVDNPAAFSHCTVKQIKDGVVTLFRPYVHTADFSHTGGVICYIGTEEWKIAVTDTRTEFDLIDRKELK